MALETVPKGGWRTPSLRDVALTAPYMHDGFYTTLDQVVEHYNRGGSPDGMGTRSARLKPLFLTQREVADLVEFLKTLTGEALPGALTTKPVLP
jgi:cytochrome c peroxidase